VYRKPYRVDAVTESPKLGGIIGLLCFVLGILASPFKSKIRLAAENAALANGDCGAASRTRTTKKGRWRVNRIGRRTVMCMLLIAALAVIWNLLGR
jgi:hypothetical protein